MKPTEKHIKLAEAVSGLTREQAMEPNPMLECLTFIEVTEGEQYQYLENRIKNAEWRALLPKI